jgi:hypothetical protein
VSRFTGTQDITVAKLIHVVLFHDNSSLLYAWKYERQSRIPRSNNSSFMLTMAQQPHTIPAFYTTIKFKPAGDHTALTYYVFLATSLTSELENHPLSVVCNCLFRTFAATLDVYNGLIKLQICKQRIYVEQRGITKHSRYRKAVLRTGYKFIHSVLRQVHSQFQIEFST